MRYLELRRHTMRVKPGEHLSQAGVDLARRVGAGSGPFAGVVSSTLPRAIETAIAMGFAVDEYDPLLCAMGDEVNDEVHWEAGFAAWSEAVRRGGAAARFAKGQAAIYRRIVAALPDGATALVVTHGGMIEAGTIAALPAADHASWGQFCDYCDGARLLFDGHTWTGIEILRAGS